MALYPNFDRGPAGSLNEHHMLLAKYGYRYYCSNCVKNIESKNALEKCSACGGPLQLLSAPKPKSEGFFEQLKKYFQKPKEGNQKEEKRMSFGKKGEEMPTENR